MAIVVGFLIGYLIISLFLDWLVFGAGYFSDRTPYLFRKNG